MTFINGIYVYIEKLWQWFHCFWPMLSCKLLDIFAAFVNEFAGIIMTAFSAIPVPDALSSFQWPTGGPLVSAMVALDVPAALAMIAGAFTIRYAKSLLRMVIK